MMDSQGQELRRTAPQHKPGGEGNFRYAGSSACSQGQRGTRHRPQDESSMVWDADEQRLQLTEEVGYNRWQFVYDTAAGIPAVHRRPLP